MRQEARSYYTYVYDLYWYFCLCNWSVMAYKCLHQTYHRKKKRGNYLVFSVMVNMDVVEIDGGRVYWLCWWWCQYCCWRTEWLKVVAAQMLVKGGEWCWYLAFYLCLLFDLKAPWEWIVIMAHGVMHSAVSGPSKIKKKKKILIIFSTENLNLSCIIYVMLLIFCSSVAWWE